MNALEPMTPTRLLALSLQTAVTDSRLDYESSLQSETAPHWDAVVITASDRNQAEGFSKQIEYRRQRGQLPVSTEFLIIPDEGDVRIGSGGSTLSVIRTLKERFGTFRDRRFLCIHAGGSSQRCPQYSALGKLFSPFCTMLGEDPATLFDEFLVTMASLPAKMKDGMLILSGDVALLYNPEMCDFGTADASIVTFREPAVTGTAHGVCLQNPETGNVKEFLHKRPVPELTAKGAVDEQGNCCIDTGMVYFGTGILERLLSLVDTDKKYRAMVNGDVRLSLYGDVNYALSETATLESLLAQTPEGEWGPALTSARKALWNAIGSFTMKCQILSPAHFIHLGSVPEILRLMDTDIREYQALGWQKQIDSVIQRADVAGYQAVLSPDADIGTGCYLEVSHIHSQAKVGDRCYISYCDLHEETVPDDMLVHGLKLRDGTFVCRILSTSDNPKEHRLFGKELDTVVTELGLRETDLWDDEDPHTLWNARLYPECESMREGVRASLRMYAMVRDGDTKAVQKWTAMPRKSLASSFRDADPGALIEWNTHMADLVRMHAVKRLIRSSAPSKQAVAVLKTPRLSNTQTAWLKHEISQLDLRDPEQFSYAIRLYGYLGVALNDKTYIRSCFQTIADTVRSSFFKRHPYPADARIVQDEITVRLPLRVNWAGGWSDTCPHCLEHGGTVLNTAIRIGGCDPVEVRIRKIAEPKIVLASEDLAVWGEFDSLEPLQNTGDPRDAFALQKACLLAGGIIPTEGGDLSDVFERLGGGFEMHSVVRNVPKGSGLGTSSILSAASIKAVRSFIGQPCPDAFVFDAVLAMEQIMTTGGGWQDQVGGLLPGIKYITANPGIPQILTVDRVSVSDATKAELNRRFALIYTGQRRLARNILRDVVIRYIGNDLDSVEAHSESREIASRMRDQLELGNVDGFAALFDEQWRLNQRIDPGTSNDLIDQIFHSIEDLIDARSCCGAGGGGFLQVILKKDITREQLRRRLMAVFADFGVDVWPCELYFG